MFIDEIQVHARAGHGGKGCGAFHPEALFTKSGPRGGNGGRGGDVILQADHDLNNLIAQYYQPRLIAEDGDPGMGKGMDGHAGKDLLIKVPCGTMVWRLLQAPEPLPERSVEQEEQRPVETLSLSSRRRPLIRHAGRERGAEIDLATEMEDKPATPGTEGKRELAADLT